MDEWMEAIPDFDELHKEPTLQEVTKALDEYLSGGADTEEEVEAVSSEVTKYGASKSDPVEDAFKSIGL
jgi:phage-related minor tail protein